jgi:serine phosphatase RsbU (regulator of sigma subunit)
MSSLPRVPAALAAAYAGTDWAASPLGPMEGWSTTLRSTVDMVFATRFPVTLFWGPEFALVYNEAYVALIGDKHPSALGTPAREVFPEVWDQIGPMMDSARSGAPTWVEDEQVPLRRRGFLEECYFTFSYSPVRNELGEVEGVMDIAAETTEQVISRRRLQLLTAVTERIANADDMEELVRVALPLLRSSTQDLPLVDIRLPGAGIGDDYRLPGAPPGEGSVLSERVERHEDGHIAWLPLIDNDVEHSPLLVVSLSRQLAPDGEYLRFLRLLAGALGQAVASIRVRHAERETAQVQRTMTEAFQRSLLPHPMGAGGPELAMRYQPAVDLAELGGDWYDWFEAPDGSLMLVIGDVAGHDQVAAATMGQVRNILRGVAFTTESPTPTAVLRGVDRALIGTASGALATALLARVTTGSSGAGLHVEWSNAGHPPPAMIGPDGRAELLATEPDLLLGVHPDTTRRNYELHLQPGATLVLYTDGLIESRNTSIDTGMTRLVATLGQTHQLNVEQISDLLMNMATSHEDDIALITLRA